jgi:Caspase domain
MPERPDDYAIVIGLNDYPQFGSQGRPLAGAIEDAERFATWLKDTNTGGGLPQDNCREILSTPDPLAPDKLGIDLALGSLITRAKAEEGGRRLYFYFSGHGQAKSPHDVALCLCHWSSLFRYAALGSASYQAMFLRCSPFAELVMLLDCCRIRSIDATGGDSEIGCPIPVEDAGRKRFMLGFATEFQNAAMEAEVEEGVTEEGPVVRGHFTEALLAALNGGAARSAGGVTASELKRYLELNVPRIAKDHEHVQNAQVIIDFPEDAQPVFGSALPEANFRIEFLPQRQGEIVLEGPELEEVRRGDASTGPWELTLTKGRYLLSDRACGDQLDIPFRPSQEVTVVTF